MEKFALTKKLYGNSYFTNRTGTDKLRQKSMAQEVSWIKANTKGPLQNICDVGCAAGEFKVHWPHTKYYGMEVNEQAVENAKSNGVLFEKNLLNADGFFDLVIFRGTIQHINSPFDYIEAAFKALKPNGYLAIIATPNTGSLVYRLSQQLPMLDPSLNLYLPSIQSVQNLVKIYNFRTIATQTPYLKSPYRSLFSDHINFLKVIFGAKPTNAFWGNSFNLIAQKCTQ